MLTRKKGRWVSPLKFVSGDSATRDFAPHGFVDQEVDPAIPFSRTYNVGPTLPTEASSAAPVGALHLEGFAGRGSKPLLLRSPLWSRVRWESKCPQLPVTLTVKCWWTFLENQTNSSNDSVFLASSAQASNDRPIQASRETVAKISCNWMGLGETNHKESDETVHERAGTRVRCNQLLHGSALGPRASGDATRVSLGRGEQNKNLGHGNLHYQCEQPAFLLHLRML